MAAIDLCTLEQVRSRATLQTQEVEQDSVIANMITEASRAIIHHCGREFAPAVTAVTRSYAFDSWTCLAAFNSPWDLRTATTVTVDVGQSTEKVLTATQYQLALADDEYGTYGGIEFDGSLSGTKWRKRRLTVVGNWGFSTIPEDVRSACVLTVLAALRGEILSFGGPIQPNSIGVGANDPIAFPPGVRGLLTPFRRAVLA